MGGARRIKYTDEVMDTIRNLVKSGYTNNQICEYFDLPPMYGSMMQKLTAIRKELNCYADKKAAENLPLLKSINNDLDSDKVVVEEKKVVPKVVSNNDIKFVADFINECDKASVMLLNSISDKIENGFATSDISLSETNSKRISVVISRLENVMFLLDNITYLKEKG